MSKKCLVCKAENHESVGFCETCGAKLGKKRNSMQYEPINPDTTVKNIFHPEKLSQEPYIIANLEKRFWAYIIDVISVFIFVTGLAGIAGKIYGNVNIISNVMGYYFESGILGIGTVPLALFFYFIITEYYTNTTIGKSVIGLMVINVYGQRPSISSIIINSFGKSFALLFDIFAALFFVHYDEGEVNREQRIFQYAAKVVVIEKPKHPSTSIHSNLFVKS